MSNPAETDELAAAEAAVVQAQAELAEAESDGTEEATVKVIFTPTMFVGGFRWADDNGEVYEFNSAQLTLNVPVTLADKLVADAAKNGARVAVENQEK